MPQAISLSRAAMSLRSPTLVLTIPPSEPIPAPEACILWATRWGVSHFVARELLRADPCGCQQDRTHPGIRQGLE
jgi:hypothetical protein